MKTFPQEWFGAIHDKAERAESYWMRSSDWRVCDVPGGRKAGNVACWNTFRPDQRNSDAVACNKVNRHTVSLCARKFLQFGLEAALGELPRPGKSRSIPDDAIAWVLHLACQKPKDTGYAHELWTYSLLQDHVRKHCRAAGHPSLTELSRSRLHRILTQGEIRPHKIRYYVELTWSSVSKMAEVLHVYKEVEIVNAGLLEGTLKEPSVVTISYDEKPGIQALATTTPDRPPAPNQFASHLRDYEYKRLGNTVSAIGFDLHGPATEIVRSARQRRLHRAAGKTGRPFPPKPVFACCSTITLRIFPKRRRPGLSLSPEPIRIVFTPKHGSWLS